MKDLQQGMQSFLDQRVAEQKELGIQVAVYLDGALVVDAFAGAADRTGRPVTGETLFPAYSTTKGIAATVIHLLAERGKLNYESPLAAYWPEFAAQDKQGITLRHGMSHAAGIPNMPLGIDYSMLFNWDLMCAKIADLKPISAPGAELAYHAITYGWILGEAAQRVDGRPFAQIMQDEICAPLGINSMFMGIPDEVESLVAVLEEAIPPTPAPLPAVEIPQAIPAWMNLTEMMNRPDARRACNPASNGIMNARAIARHYAALLPGGVDGIELLPPSRITAATERQYATNGRNEPSPMNHGLGYALLDESSTTFGHPGHGGSVGLADSKHRFSLGLTRNRFGPENSWELVVNKFRELLAAN